MVLLYGSSIKKIKWWTFIPDNFQKVVLNYLVILLGLNIKGCVYLGLNYDPQSGSGHTIRWSKGIGGLAFIHRTPYTGTILLELF